MSVVAKPSGEAENPTASRAGYDRTDVNSYEWKLLAYKRAIKRHIPLVSRCSFIQQGSCHLCSATAVTLVVNVCPQFDFGHSICIKHIESVTKITVRELLDGAVFTCPICTHECPCGLCERLVAREFEYYDGWSQYHTAKQSNKSSLAPAAAPTALPVASLATVRTLNTDGMPRHQFEAKTLSIPPKMAAKSTVRVNMAQQQPPLIDLADAKDVAPRKIAAKSLPRVSSKQQVLEAKTTAILDSDTMLRADSKDVPALRASAPPRQLKAAKSLLPPKPAITEQPTKKKSVAHHSDEDVTEISAEESASTSSGSDDDEPRLKPVKLTHVRAKDSTLAFQRSEAKDSSDNSDVKRQSATSGQVTTHFRPSDSTSVLKPVAKTPGFVNIMPKPALMEAMEAPLRVEPNMLLSANSSMVSLDQMTRDLKRTNSSTNAQMSSKAIPSEAKSLSTEAASSNFNANAQLKSKINGNFNVSSPQVQHSKLSPGQSPNATKPSPLQHEKAEAKDTDGDVVYVSTPSPNKQRGSEPQENPSPLVKCIDPLPLDSAASQLTASIQEAATTSELKNQLSPPKEKKTRSTSVRDFPAAKQKQNEDKLTTKSLAEKRPRSAIPNPIVVPTKRARQVEEQKAEQVEENIDDEEDEEVDRNLDYCSICKDDGDLVCCDKCPRSFHLDCLGMQEDDLPDGFWQCEECKGRQSELHFEAVYKRKPKDKTKLMHIVLDALIQHPFAKPFLNPVEGVKGYDLVVKKRMDLITVQTRLQHGHYSTSNLFDSGFVQDIRLIWYNCRQFNDDESGLSRAAMVLSAGFEQMVQRLTALYEPKAV